MTPADPDPLILKTLKGDREAFALLIERHYDFAFRVAFRMTANQEDARDIVQEAFVKVWNSSTSFHRQAKFSTWLYSIVSNLCIDCLRKRKNHVAIQVEDVLERFTQSEDLQLENRELAAIIRSLSEDLSPGQKVVFVLRDLEGLSARETARILKQSPECVKSNLWHARRAIRNKLIRYYKVKP